MIDSFGTTFLPALVVATLSCSFPNYEVRVRQVSLDPDADIDSPDEGTAEARDAPIVPASCSGYCDEVMRNCVAINVQYTSAAICMGMCASMPLGTSVDQTGDTLGCRFHFAELTSTDAKVQCAHA